MTSTSSAISDALAEATFLLRYNANLDDEARERLEAIRCRLREIRDGQEERGKFLEHHERHDIRRAESEVA